MELKKIYLAIPYSSMEESSFYQCGQVTAYLMSHYIGPEFSKRYVYNVFSPITHSHTLAKYWTIPGTWDFWKQADKQFIDFADELFILIPKEGFSKVLHSTGVIAEYRYALKINKPIHLIRWDNNKVHFIESDEKNDYLHKIESVQLNKDSLL